MKQLLIAIIAAISVLSLSAQTPSISSFSPAGDKAGSNVTISGTNFSTTPASNIVYFGPVQATVTAASSNSISAVVPAGAGYAHITVKKDSLTAWSPKPFIYTPVTNGEPLNSDAFAAASFITKAIIHCVADFDNNGTPDIAAYTSSRKISIFSNSSTAAAFSITNHLTLATTISGVNDIIAADFNGDGKMDIAVALSNSTGLYVFANTSSVGFFSFADPVYYTLPDTPLFLKARDIDKDGKTDLLVTYTSSGSAFSVLRNNGISGNLSFATRQNFAYGSIPGGSGNVGSNGRIEINDIDGDGKPDVLIQSAQFRPFLLYPNTSTPGTVSFGTKIVLESGRTANISSSFYQLSLADIDRDNKADIVFSLTDSNFISVFRNTSVPGSFSFAAKKDFASMANIQTLVITDITGDTIPDIVTMNYDSVFVYKNSSSTGNINLAPYTALANMYYLNRLSANDMDMDGKADLLISGNDFGDTSTNRLLIMRCQTGAPVINNAAPITADPGTVITITGLRFINVSAVTFGGIPAASFTVVSDTVIQAVLGIGATGNIAVATATGYTQFPGFTFLPPIPVIHSFEPTSGAVGSTVIIRGKNFSNTSSGNIVYFGSGRATVNAATDTSLTVTVPANSSYQPICISIPARTLSTCSASPFITTFGNGVSNFSSDNFDDTISYTHFSIPWRLTTADFTGDNKPEILSAVYFNTNRLSVFRNNSDNRFLHFGPRQDYFTFFGSTGASSGNLTAMLAADINGDGLQDIAAVTANGDSLCLYNNSGISNSIAFDPLKNYVTGYDPTMVSAADFDGDARIDFAVTNATSGTISVFHNNGLNGNISVKNKLDYVCGSAPQEIAIADFDNDGKKDMVCINYNTSDASLFLNTSTRGTISFAPKTTMAVSAYPLRVSAADIDLDGNIDLVVTSSGTPRIISVYRNISSTGNIQFAAAIDLPMLPIPRCSAIADIDGDGKPDIASCTNNFPNSVSLFKNNSTPGNISFATRVDISKAGTGNDIIAADVTGDGKPELILCDDNKKVTIIKNVIGEPVTTRICTTTDTLGLQSDISGSSYQWQENSGNGFADISDNASYTGTSTIRLTLHNIPSSWYGNQYRCVINGNNYSKIYRLKITAVWVGGNNGAWENPVNWKCGQLPDSNTDVIINSGQPLLSSDVTIKSLQLKTGAGVNVSTGFNLTVLQ